MANNELDDLETGFPALVGCGDFPDPCLGRTMGKLTGEHNDAAFHTTLLAELRMIRQVLVELGGKTY
jgi:hypothetical protein